MKKKFSTSWIASKQPRKQRKYVANAPKHLKGKLMSATLTKELRTKHSRRNVEIRKGDTVKIMRGSFKKKTGKVSFVNVKKSRVYVEGIQLKKKDGSKVNYPLHPSILQITELAIEDKRRLGDKKEIKKSEKKPEVKKEQKEMKPNTIKKTEKTKEIKK